MSEKVRIYIESCHNLSWCLSLRVLPRYKDMDCNLNKILTKSDCLRFNSSCICKLIQRTYSSFNNCLGNDLHWEIGILFVLAFKVSAMPTGLFKT